MPYKRVGKKVMVLKDGVWKLLKEHPSKEKAFAHLWALRTNVEHKK